MPNSSFARLRSSRQKRSCCVHWYWSTLRCGRNEHSTPAPHTNCWNGSLAMSDEPAVADDGCCVVEAFDETMRVRSPCSSSMLLIRDGGLFSCLDQRPCSSGCW